MTGRVSSISRAAGDADLKDWTGSDTAVLQQRIVSAMARSIGFLSAMQADNAPRGVLRIAPPHDPEQWPGMLLPGSYYGIMCIKLFGEIAQLRGNERAGLVAWFEAARRPNGTFAIAGMNEGDVYKKPDRDETWRYIDFHVTNNALGAIEALDPLRRPVLDFIEPWLDPLILKAWLAGRDMREPQLEGQNIVNLASFLLLKTRHGEAGDKAVAKAALHILFDWLERNQEPDTGFWGVGQGLGATQLLQAMAGSVQAYHPFYALRRPVPHHAKAVDYALSLSPPKIHGAEIDVDLVDLLVHAALLSGHRGADITRWLARMLDALLDYQNADGGFPDQRGGIRRQDGWERGYEEKQGVSSTYGTWFRWVAIAMISSHLWPDWRVWGFRRMIGAGYRRDLLR